MTAHLVHHFTGGAAHSLDGERREEEGHHGSDKHSHQVLRVEGTDLIIIDKVLNRGVFDIDRLIITRAVIDLQEYGLIELVAQ